MSRAGVTGGVLPWKVKPGSRRTLIWLLAGLGVLVLGWLVWRSLGAGGRRDETWTRIQRQGVLRVGMDASYPPFELVDDARGFHGFDVDLARELGARWGVEVQFVNVHFDGLYDALYADKFDIILSALPYDRTMTRDVRYSQSYFNAGQVLLTRTGDAAINAFGDLRGGRVAVELGAEAHQLARQLARDRGMDVEVVPVREPEEVLALLEQGEVDAILCDKVTALTYVGQGMPVRFAGADLTSDPYVIAVRPDAPILLEQINQALQEWQESGFLEQRALYWFQEDK
ncbi:MAG: amino acid ABC transporter substrate-binding protein [Chloroflexi bacterium]|nr:amino acid ABC transporter substrate-binding protein [Chloroflexota bacterium]